MAIIDDGRCPHGNVTCSEACRKPDRATKIRAILDTIKALEGEPITYSTGLLLAKAARELRLELEDHHA